METDNVQYLRYFSAERWRPMMDKYSDNATKNLLLFFTDITDESFVALDERLMLCEGIVTRILAAEKIIGDSATYPVHVSFEPDDLYVEIAYLSDEKENVVISSGVPFDEVAHFKHPLINTSALLVDVSEEGVQSSHIPAEKINAILETIFSLAKQKDHRLVFDIKDNYYHYGAVFYTDHNKPNIKIHTMIKFSVETYKIIYPKLNSKVVQYVQNARYD